MALVTGVDTRTTSERLSDAVTRFCGSWTFILSGLALTAGWIALMGPFDPFPYIFYNLFLTIVSTFQSPLIMMSQNRAADIRDAEIAEILAHLDILDHKLNAALAGIADIRGLEE